MRYLRRLRLLRVVIYLVYSIHDYLPYDTHLVLYRFLTSLPSATSNVVSCIRPV